MPAGKLDTAKYNSMVNNASGGVVISSQIFKDFIADVKDKIDSNYDEAVKKSGDTMTGPLNMGTNNIIGSNSINQFLSKVIQRGGGNTGLYYNVTAEKFDFFYGGTVILTIESSGIISSIKGTTGLKIAAGSGSPEGVITAAVGSIYLRTDGGPGTTLYVKRSGTGNTGWFAVA